jgi:hypothetical protein
MDNLVFRNTLGTFSNYDDDDDNLKDRNKDEKLQVIDIQEIVNSDPFTNYYNNYNDIFLYYYNNDSFLSKMVFLLFLIILVFFIIKIIY